MRRQKARKHGESGVEFSTFPIVEGEEKNWDNEKKTHRLID